MAATNDGAGTRIDEIADGIYRISTPVPPSAIPGGFTFNRYLIADEQPLLYHAGLRRMFPLTRDAVATVLAPERLRYVTASHFEADECGALNDLLAVAPQAEPLCGRVAAMVSLGDVADRPPRALADGEELSLGRHSVRWIDAPHLPHAWDCGHLFESSTRTLFCGDLFTQGGHEVPPLVEEEDILGASEAFRKHMDYFSQTRNVRVLMQKLIATAPTTLACMHGSAWRGDGARLLGELADVLA